MRYVILDVETCAVDSAGGFIEKPSAPSNYKDPEAIAKYVANAERGLIDRAALDIDLARIACLGYWDCSDRLSEPQVISAENEDEERRLLAAFFADLSIDPTRVRLVTFNGFKYDLPLIARRAAYLGLPTWRPNIDKYRSINIDLWQLLSNNGATPAHGLSWYIKRLGWTDLEDKTKGKDMPELIRTGDWAAVEAHCLNDLKATHRLARWCGVELPAIEEAIV